MIQIQYDSFPWETSFELKKIVSEDRQETEFASHSGSDGDKNYDESICLVDGMYSFSFYDSYGDGFRGVYSLTLESGETIITRDNLVSRYGEEVSFRLPFDGEKQVTTFESLERPTIGSTPFPTPFPTFSKTAFPNETNVMGPSLAPSPEPTAAPTTPIPTFSQTETKVVGPTAPESTDPSPGPPSSFNCPAATFVGCTADDPNNPEDECSAEGAKCNNGNDREFCCPDNCPRLYCTEKEASYFFN